MTAENRESSESSQTMEDLLALYIDRLNDGEQLNQAVILAKHPMHGNEILEHLESFLESTIECDDESISLGTLADYTLRRQIGRGGMGVVYEASCAEIRLRRGRRADSSAGCGLRGGIGSGSEWESSPCFSWSRA